MATLADTLQAALDTHAAAQEATKTTVHDTYDTPTDQPTGGAQ